MSERRFDGTPDADQAPEPSEHQPGHPESPDHPGHPQRPSDGPHLDKDPETEADTASGGPADD